MEIIIQKIKKIKSQIEKKKCGLKLTMKKLE